MAKEDLIHFARCWKVQCSSLNCVNGSFKKTDKNRKFRERNFELRGFMPSQKMGESAKAQPIKFLNRPF